MTNSVLGKLKAEKIDDGYTFEGGLTLRDYFAAQAIAGIMKDSTVPKSIARRVYEIADAMLKEREK